MAELDDDLEVEFTPEESLAPDTMSWPEGQVYFYPDVATFCEEHEAKAVMVTAGAVWLLPADGGKWLNVEDHGKPKPEARPIRRVQ